VKYILALFLLSSCAMRPSNEMEGLTEDVLKHKSGIEIQVIPLPKTNSKLRPD